MKLIIEKGQQIFFHYKGCAVGSIAVNDEPITIELEKCFSVTFVKYIVNRNLVQFIIDDYSISNILGGDK